jgi:hypothetical protein
MQLVERHAISLPEFCFYYGEEREFPSQLSICTFGGACVPLQSFRSIYREERVFPSQILCCNFGRSVSSPPYFLIRFQGGARVPLLKFWIIVAKMFLFQGHQLYRPMGLSGKRRRKNITDFSTLETLEFMGS